ncbi:4102_t:CDS:2, partial [Acaulospora colombiana]
METAEENIGTLNSTEPIVETPDALSTYKKMVDAATVAMEDMQIEEHDNGTQIIKQGNKWAESVDKESVCMNLVIRIWITIRIQVRIGDQVIMMNVDLNTVENMVLDLAIVENMDLRLDVVKGLDSDLGIAANI